MIYKQIVMQGVKTSKKILTQKNQNINTSVSDGVWRHIFISPSIWEIYFKIRFFCRMTDLEINWLFLGSIGSLNSYVLLKQKLKFLGNPCTYYKKVKGKKVSKINVKNDYT